MSAVKKNQENSREVKVLTIPKSTVSRKASTRRKPASNRKMTDNASAVDLVVSSNDLAVVPQLKASRPASRVNAKPMDQIGRASCRERV